MIDLSTLPVPEGCPFIETSDYFKCRVFRPLNTLLLAMTKKDRFIICATMTAWLCKEYANTPLSNEIIRYHLDEAGRAWHAAEAEAYAAIKEQSK